MILFADDWVTKHPDAIINYNTSNKSFVRISALYKEMGVKNHAFPLQLLNKDLLNVDPWNPNISDEEIAMVTMECYDNFFYFIREVARIPALAGSQDSPFRANRGNMALYFLFFTNVTPFLVQIRQTGKTTSVVLLADYLMNIRCTGATINLLTKDDKLRTDTISDLRDATKALPFYLIQHTKKDISNTEMLGFSSLNNEFKAYLAAASKSAALKVGRGLTAQVALIDEVPFLSNIGLTLPALLASGTAAREIARKNEEPYGTVFTTTAGKKDTVDGRYTYNLLQKAAIWTEAFFDAKDKANLHAIVRARSISNSHDFGIVGNSKGTLMVNCTFGHRQLGYSDDWLRNALEENMSTADDANRDFFNLWTSGTQLSPLDNGVTELIRKSERDVVYPELRGDFVTLWYIQEDRVDTYMEQNDCIAALDTSNASGGDDISLVIVNIRTGGTIASGSYNELNLITFSEWISKFFIRFPKLTFIIENRSTGQMLQDYIIIVLEREGIDPFKRLYNTIVQRHDEDKERYKEICSSYRLSQRLSTVYKKHFGFATSGSGETSRTELYSTTLRQAASLSKNIVHDKKLIDQILGLEIRNGRVDHEEGGHDDMVIGWLLCFWFILRGRNVQHYGINPRLILSDNKIYNNQMVPDIEEYGQQKALRDEIEEVYGLLIKERNDVLQYKYEFKLRALSSKLKLLDGEVFSVDTLIDNVRRERIKKRSIG